MDERIKNAGRSYRYENENTDVIKLAMKSLENNQGGETTPQKDRESGGKPHGY